MSPTGTWDGNVEPGAYVTHSATELMSGIT